MDWFEAFCKERDSLVMNVNGKEQPVNDCTRCVHYRNGKFSSPCEACSEAVFEGVMNMHWEATEETLDEMRKFRKEYKEE